MPTNRRARVVAFQILYGYEVNPTEKIPDDMIRERVRGDVAQIEFARELVRGVFRHRDEIDVLIRNAAANWSLERMAPTDRNVLRMGAFELLHTDTPPALAINEAIEIAKEYGNKNSGGFVNAILDRIKREQGTGNREQG